MSGLFHYDSPFWRFMGKLVDIGFLTILWLLFSLPVFTVGASTTALYYVSLKLAKNQEGPIFKSFLSSFKSNFKQATVIWLIMLLLGGLLGFNLWFSYNQQGSFATVLLWTFIFIAAVYLMLLTYIFPLLSRLDNTTPRLMMMAFVLSIKNLGWTLLMLTTTACIVALAIFAFWPLLIVSVGAIAYIHSLILTFLFKKYGWNLDDSDTREHEDDIQTQDPCCDAEIPQSKAI